MRRILSFIALGAAVMLAGCSTNVPDLSHVDNDLAAQYVADALLRNDKHYDESLDYDHSILEATPEPEPTEAPTPEPEEGSSPDQTGAGGQGGQAQGEPAVSNVSLSDIYGVQGVSVTPSSYKMQDSYDEGGGLSVVPHRKNKLIVVYFTVSNNSGKAKRVKLGDVSPQLYLDGSSVGQPMPSLAAGDLQSFNERIAAGKKKQGVLLFEVPSNTKMSKLEVRFSKGNSQASVTVD